MVKITSILTTLLLIGFTAVAPAAMSIEWKLADDPGGHTPAGYVPFDLWVSVETNALVQELVVFGTAPGDIYQHPLGSNLAPNPAFFEQFPSLEFDTYVTLGAWPYPSPVNIIGGAVDVQAVLLDYGTFKSHPINPVAVFDDQNLDIAWGPQGGYFSGPGTFHIARVVIKHGLVLPYYYVGWEAQPYVAPELRGSYDFSQHEPRQQGFLVAPEPATLGLLVVGGLAMLKPGRKPN